MQQFEDLLCRRASRRKAVGFDVFGTLLLRDVQRPTDLFHWMEKSGTAPAGFAQARVEAERQARATGAKEVTLADIYARPCLKGANPEAEWQAELHCVVPNPKMLAAAHTLHEQGKKLYAISDMYLPPEQVERMLRACGYDFLDGVYVSSQYGVQKRSGKLFRIFLRQTGLKAGEVLFVGDDRRADGLGAALAGIRAMILPVRRAGSYPTGGESWQQRADQAFLENRLPAIAPEQRTGFETIGPLVTAFTAFVREQRLRYPEASLVFLARDMHLICETYRQDYPEDHKVRYLKASRRSLCPALLQCPMDEENLGLLADALPRQRLTVRQILDYCGFDRDVKLKDFAPDFQVDLHSRPLAHKTREVLLTIVAFGKTPAGESVRRQALLIRQYLQEQLTNPAILVDIGSGGTTQRLLETLSGQSLQGIYLACDERLHQCLPKERTSVFLFEGEPAPLWYWAGQPLLERLISEPCGATVGYRREGASVIPELEQTNVPVCIAAVQAGAKQYHVMRRHSLLAEKPIHCPERAFLEMVRAPLSEDAKTLGSMTVEDGGVYPLASPAGWKQYLLHPGRLAVDFAEARWKTAFLRRLLPLPLPYDRFYEILKHPGKEK